MRRLLEVADSEGLDNTDCDTSGTELIVQTVDDAGGTPNGVNAKPGPVVVNGSAAIAEGDASSGWRPSNSEASHSGE